MNECIEGTDNCHEDADCYDTIGNFTCVCSPGYSGDGVDNCTGMLLEILYIHEVKLQCISGSCLNSESSILRY